MLDIIAPQVHPDRDAFLLKDLLELPGGIGLLPSALTAADDRLPAAVEVHIGVIGGEVGHIVHGGVLVDHLVHVIAKAVFCGVDAAEGQTTIEKIGEPQVEVDGMGRAQTAAIAYGQMIVSVNTQPSVLSRIVSLLILILNYVAIVWAVVLFIRLIVSINKSDIFNWKNVRRLRRLGILLIIGFVCTFLLAFLSFHNVEKVFSVTGYSLSMADMVHITSLVLGISALIVAEVFAIGLKMKEEQELTI